MKSDKSEKKKIIPVLNECPLCKTDHHKTFKAVGKLKTFPLVIIYFCHKCKTYYRHDVINDKNEIIEKPSKEVKLFRIPSIPDRISSTVSKFMVVCRFIYPKFPGCKNKCRDAETIDCPFF